MAAPGWWEANRPHWSGRTIALATIAGVAVAATGVVLAVTHDANSSGPPQPTTPAVAHEEQGDCSPNSEGDALVGWGPERPVYRDNTFPDSLTFNSTYENAVVGDERNWVRAKPVDDASATYADKVEVRGGVEYWVSAYVRLDGPADQVANDPVVSFNVPVCTGHRIGVSGYLEAENVFPIEIWDGVEFWAREDFNLAVVPDSAVVISNHVPDPGLPVSTNDIVTSTGVTLGADSPDGTFKPGYEEVRYVQFRVKAQTATG